MSLTIGSNIASLIAQRGLSNASNDLARSLTRLSSGLRINSASDDAAGLSIADNLKSNTKLFSVAVRNLNDGISALSIASSTLDNQSNILTRMIELAEQSANGTFSSTQRDSLQTEYLALTYESARLAATASFNGNKFLLGSNRGGIDQIMLQAGIDGSDLSRIGIEGADTGSFSGILNVSQLYFISGDISGSEYTQAEMEERFGQGLFNLSENKAVAIFEQSSYGTYAAFVLEKGDDGIWRDTINETLSLDSSGRISSADSTSLLAGGVDLRALRFSHSSGTYAPNLGATSAIEFSSVTTQAYARAALDILRTKFDEISLLKGKFGAFQSRVTTALSVNLTLRDQSAAAESRIRDVDVAEESALLTTSKIRQQIATQILQSANMAPRLVLDLLR